MGRIRTAFGIASLLIVPVASADYSFSFSTRGHIDHAGAASASTGGAAFGDESSGADSFGSGGSGDGTLASLASLAKGSSYPGAANSGASNADNALDCIDSTSAVADAPRSTQSCWLIALAASESSVPLAGKATDPYPIASPGNQDWNDWYPPTSFGSQSSGSGSSGDYRTSNSGGGSAGAPTASTSDDRGNTTSGQSAGGSTDPFRFHSGSDGRGDDILSLGETTQSIGDGTDSSSHHHHGGTSGGGTSGGDTSISLIDTSLITSTDSAEPTHHRAHDPVITTVVDPASTAATLNTTIDQVLTGPSVNVSVAPQQIPEPGTLVLVGVALVAIAVLPRRRRR